MRSIDSQRKAGEGMENIQFPHGRWNSADELIEESKQTGKQVRDLLGYGLPEDYTQEQLLDAYLKEECSEGYVAYRLNTSRVGIRRLVEERQK